MQILLGKSMHYFQGSREHRPPPPWGASSVRPFIRRVESLSQLSSDFFKHIWITCIEHSIKLEYGFCQDGHPNGGLLSDCTCGHFLT